MKHIRFFSYFSILVAIILMVLAFSCSNKPDTALVIYAYDSFAGEWGPGPAIIAGFEAKTGIKVEMIVPGDSIEALARLIEEKSSPRKGSAASKQADILLGLDGNTLPMAVAKDVLAAYKPLEADAIPEHLVLDQNWFATPYDFGSFCIMWDSQKLELPPQSLEDLTKPEYHKKLVIMDPRTSTPGLAFVAWTKSVYKDGMGEYWKRLKPSILTMAPGWDLGYGLFTSGEAPLVLSYTTSAAYHAEYETAGRYKPLEFSDGHPVQVEGVAIVKGTKHRKEAEAFIDFMLSPFVQELLPTTNWMYPVVPGTALPKSYEEAPLPKKLLPNEEALEKAVKLALDSLVY
ncbi:thiamine ABC transporter substrate-binding protein [Spirochaetota bacterium]